MRRKTLCRLSWLGRRPEFFPIEELQTCVNAVLRREATDVLNLGSSDGYAPLKEALLDMLQREGISAKDENLLITDGCQQSLDLISKAFVRPGDCVDSGESNISRSGRDF